MTGLTTAEARARLASIGPNSTEDPTPHPVWRALGKLWAPVPWMLEAAIVLQLVLGETVEATVIAVLLVFNAGLGFLQESRAQATLDALRARLALTAAVRRDGAWTTLPVAQLVPGDEVKLSLGAVVPADVTLREGDVLLDQSMLTGESLPIDAAAGTVTFAGALVRRGEAVAEVTATGPRTKFGRTAELVRTAHGTSGQQRAVLRVVRNLAMFNGSIVVLQVVYAVGRGMSVVEIIPLMLTAMLAAIPVALPATFTLATTLGARALARHGVLPTRLSAVDEAATMDVLCADKTGTLTQNALTVSGLHPLPGFDEGRLLGLAALASSDGGQDPVDGAIRAAAAAGGPVAGLPVLDRFIPFDPARKMAEAVAIDAQGQPQRIVKGAYAVVAALCKQSPDAEDAAGAMAGQGSRVLAVAVDGKLAGLIGLSDPPRPESAELIAQLRRMGVRTVMVTGDAVVTAGVVAKAVGIEGAVCPAGAIPSRVAPADYAVFAGVLPEDKFTIVKAFQAGGHTVGMCGDGANDAPALRQAQIGIAVSTATDVAKSASGIVLTTPGLSGIVGAVEEGRITFQRILTYCLRSITRKLDQMLFLTAGLVMTGHAIMTPMLMVVLMVPGDFLAMAATTDNVRASAKPNVWRIDNITIAGLILGASNLAFCSSVLAVGTFVLRLPIDGLRTLAAIALVFSGQAVLYCVRERERIWSSRPSWWLMGSSVTDVLLIGTLATQGVLMTALPFAIVVSVLGAAGCFALALDTVKATVFRRLAMA
jgi:H+-transporting ATPase